jgi:hypothetical protein
MDVVAMTRKILRVPYTMVGKSSLPDLPSTKCQAKCAGVASLDQLHAAFQGDAGWGYQEMNMLWHQYKRVETIPLVAAVPVENLDEETDVVFDYK